MSNKTAIIGGVVVMLCCSASFAAAMMMGGDDTKSPGPSPPTDPCAGLTDSSLASSVSVECLRKVLRDEGCTERGTVWPVDDYNGWWRQSPQGNTTVWCDSSGSPCGAGNFATIKSDIHAWATLTDAAHVAGCGKNA